MGDALRLISDVGFPIAAAGASGYLVFLTIKFILDGVTGSVMMQANIVKSLDNRVQTMNNDLVKIDALMSYALGVRPNVDRIAAKDGKGSRDTERHGLRIAMYIATGIYIIPLAPAFAKIWSSFKGNVDPLSASTLMKRKNNIQAALRAAARGESQLARDIAQMTTSAPAACFSVDPSTLIAGNGAREEHQALIGGHMTTPAAVAPVSSYAMGRGAAAPAAQTGMTGNQKVKYLPLLPMV